MKKKLLLLIIPFLITGCTASYNLEIQDDYILENISVVIPKSQAMTNSNFDSFIDDKIKVYAGSDKYYNSISQLKNDNYYVSYNYKHDIFEYRNSTFLNKCYADSQINVTDDKIDILTSNVFQCIKMEDGLYAEKVDLKIKTKLKVLDNNADEISNNTYIWHMDSYDYSDKPIKMSLERNSQFSEKIKNSLNNNFYVFLFVGIVTIIILVILLYFYIKHKNEKINKF